MSDPTLAEALRVVLAHLRGTPAVPAPSIAMPLAEFEAMQAEMARLKSIAGEMTEAGHVHMAMNPRLVVKVCDAWMRNPAGLAPHARAAAEASDHG